MLKNGISPGLMLWLFFLIVFVALGYSVLASILAGAIGGLSGGRIVTWWHSKDSPPSQQFSEEHEEAIPKKSHRMGIIEAQRHRKIREKGTPKGQVFAMKQLGTKLRRSLRRR